MHRTDLEGRFSLQKEAAPSDSQTPDFVYVKEKQAVELVTKGIALPKKLEI